MTQLCCFNQVKPPISALLKYQQSQGEAKILFMFTLFRALVE